MTTNPNPDPPAVWIDGDPLMEAIAAAVWERCGRDDVDMPQLTMDDPRTVAAVAASVARQQAAVSVVPPATNQAGWLAAALFVEAMNEACDNRRPCESCTTREDVASELRRLAAEAPHTATPPAPAVVAQPGKETSSCGPTPDTCDAEAGEPCANHEREAAHAEGEHCFCGPECQAPQ